MESINLYITCRIDMMQIIDNRFLGTHKTGIRGIHTLSRLQSEWKRCDVNVGQSALSGYNLG